MHKLTACRTQPKPSLNNKKRPVVPKKKQKKNTVLESFEDKDV